MTRRAIDASELPAELRARLRGAGGELSPEEAGEAARRSAVGRKRARTGQQLEADLDITHRQYEFLKWGKLWPHSPPFIRTAKRGWQPRGAAPVDRTGHVRIVADVNARVRGHRDGRVIPVAFDVKRLGERAATYQHAHDQQHQLHDLKSAHENGQAAFLLVEVPAHGRLYLIPIQHHYTDLLSGRGVLLYEHRPRLGIAGLRPELLPLLPSVGRGETAEIAGYDWIPLLRYVLDLRAPGS